MVTAGDVLSVVAFLVGLSLTSWALIVSFGLLFSDRVAIAKEAVETAPKKSIGLGLLLVLIPGLLSVVLLSQPLPLGKLVGWVLLLSLLAIGVLGAAGIAHSAGQRMKQMSPDLNDYTAFVKAVGFLVTGAMVPLLGWFAFGPIVMVASLGCGWKAMFTREYQSALNEVR